MTLTPDLWGAASAARDVCDHHQILAAKCLVPRIMRYGGRRHDVPADHDRAVEHARQAQAAEYEARALQAAASGEVQR